MSLGMRKQYTEEARIKLVEQIHRLVKKRVCYEHIALELGLPYGTVTGWHNKYYGPLPASRAKNGRIKRRGDRYPKGFDYGLSREILK